MGVVEYGLDGDLPQRVIDQSGLAVNRFIYNAKSRCVIGTSFGA